MGRNGSNRAIHVLAVTADEEFATALRGHFQSSTMQIQIVGTVGEAIDRLASDTQVDCIVSDHDLPDTDGIAFLQTVRAQTPTLPFVLFTSEGSEAVASRAISAEVTEYLIKERYDDQWERLATLIKDAVAYHRSQSDLVEPSTRTRTVLDAVRDAIVIVRNGDIKYLNTTGIDLIGGDAKAAIIGQSIDQFIDIDDRLEFSRRLTDIQALDRTVEHVETSLKRDDDISVPVEVTATYVEWEDAPASLLSIRDIRERKEYETIVRRFRRAIEAAGHAVYLTDPDGTITYVNPAFEEATGYDAKQAIGQTPQLLSSGEMPDEYYDRLWSTITNGEVWAEEIVNRRRSGELYHAHQTIAPVFDDGGDIEQFVAIQTDITDRKETQRELERYREIVQRLDDPIMLQDRDGKFLLLNDAVTDFAGIAAGDLVGKDEFVFMEDDAASTINDKKAEVIEEERPIEYEIAPQFDLTNKTATFSTKRYPYYDDEELAGTLAICRDVTDLKRREEELQRYEQAIMGATDLIAATDRHGQYLFANSQYCEYHGIDPDAVTEYSLSDIFEGDTLTTIETQFERALEGETVRYRMERTHPTRGDRILDVRYYPLEDDERATGVVAVMRDITDREDRTRQLRVVDRVLRHNLRNELTIIIGLAEEIETNVSDRSAEAAADIVEHVNQLLTTSEKSRNITQILSDQPQLSATDIAAVVEGVAAEASNSWPEAEVQVTTPEKAVVLTTDHIYDALGELVTNAIVHNDSDPPTVDLRVTTEGNVVRVSVLDNGPGIPDMDRDVLEFGREKDALYHGSGLGLWMVYWIVHRSGGSINVRDRERRGTEILLEFSSNALR